MKKIAVISDIHANFGALEAVLADMESHGVEEIISLGDNIGYGPEPERVCALLRARQVTSVLGNHEFAVVNMAYRNRLNPQARQSLETNLARLTPEDEEYIARLPQVFSRYQARFVHGCPPKSVCAYLFRPRYRMICHLFAAISERVCFYGHTHALDMFSHDGKRCRRHRLRPGEYTLEPQRRYFINPGSVGQPRDLINNRAKYLIWERERQKIILRQVPYNVQDTVDKIKALDLPAANWQRLL